MARKVRLEYEGAIYRVINRGNYRSWIFEAEGTRKAFEKCLFEACEKSDWVLHAYVLMGNHYHLAIETPHGNLVAGMTWLQSTFATRFNRYRKESGHLFQGRYKALAVQDEGWLGNLCQYIHLNPVRAGLIDVKGLRDYRFSTYWYLWRPRKRPEIINVETCLESAGELKDTPAGRKNYEKYLEWMNEDDQVKKEACFDAMSRGWALGGKDFKKELLNEHRERLGRMDLGEDDVRELRRLQWEEVANRCLATLGKGSREIASEAKSVPWKVAVAAFLKRKTQASNPWIAKKLNMGTPNGVSHYVGLINQAPGRKIYEILIKEIEV